MATYESLKQRWQLIDSIYREHYDQVLALQGSALLDEMVRQVVDELGAGIAGNDRAQAFLNDPVTIFRFLRKAHFDDGHACELLRRTLKWRLETSVDMVAPSSIDTLYSETPLFYLHPSVTDKFGRVAAIINMRHMARPEDGSLDSMKEFMAYMLEIARRYLADMSKRDVEGKPHIQMVILLDLAGSSLSNLEVEMLPFMMDLLKNHFPGMIGATYILNYGWAYAGMWAVAKRVLPKVALEKILFPAKNELLTYFNADHLLMEHQGNLKYVYRLGNNHILTKYGRPSYFLRHRTSTGTPSHSALPSPSASRPISRVASFESLGQETFYSLPGTPKMGSNSRTPLGSHHNLQSLRNGANHRHTPLWLDMTMSRSPSADKHSPVTPIALLPSKDISIRPSAATQSGRDSARRARFSLDGQHSANEAFESEKLVDWDEESLSSEDSGTGMASDGRGTETRAESLARLRTQLERGGHSARSNTSKSTLPGHISPYNAINPFYGYPAQRFLPSTSDQGYGKTPAIRPYHSRRRKRDLLKTLSYLFALRLLAAHRKLKWRLSVAWNVIWNTLARWEAVTYRPSPSRRPSSDTLDDGAGDTPIKRKKGVHWDAEVAVKHEKKQTSSLARVFWPFLLLRRIPRWLIFLGLVLFVRSRFFKVRARAVVNLARVWMKEVYQVRLQRRLEGLMWH